MKILFSYPTEIKDEGKLINELMNSRNWDIFHLRKPDWNKTQVIQLINVLNEEVKSRMVIHYHHDLVEAYNLKGSHVKYSELSNCSGNKWVNSVSCHSFEEVKKIDTKLEYCFLSPIFDSISKEEYRAKFDKGELKKFLMNARNKDLKIIGLGGVSRENYSELIELGFDGGAFLGSVWTELNVINN